MSVPRNGKVEIQLIPLDPESPEHRERLYQQRVAAGWAQELVGGWMEMQRKGEKGIHWIVLRPSPTSPPQNEQHLRHYPTEQPPLSSTARSILTRPYTAPDPARLITPIGHISLDASSPLSPQLADARHGIYHISTFYISGALQNRGIGRAAMDAMEEMAIKEFGARQLTLYTISKTSQEEVERYRACGREVPKIFNQDWYQRRGYNMFAERADAWRETDLTGIEALRMEICNAIDIGVLE